MPTSEQFSRADVQRILNVSAKQLDYWERLQFVSPKKGRPGKIYDFSDLISLRTAKQLVEKGIPASRLRRSLSALRAQLSEVQAPLHELRILSNGREVVVEQNGARVEPISGQLVLNFETRELCPVLQVPGARAAERDAEELFAFAVRVDSRGNEREAIEAYKRVLQADPKHVDALMNLGTLHYEQGELEQAEDCFRRAAGVAPENPLAHYNLGSVLEALGRLAEARVSLRKAVALDESRADPHYNLAYVCEQLGDAAEARKHWRAYLELDSTGYWATQARQHLSLPQTRHPSQKS